MASKDLEILVCDDDALVRKSLQMILKPWGNVTAVRNTNEAHALLTLRKFDLLFLDIQIDSPHEGLDYLPRLRDLDSDVPVIILSGIADYKIVKKALQRGANDYLLKGGDPEEIELTVERVLKTHTLSKANRQTKKENERLQNRYQIVGESNATKILRKLIEKFRQGTGNVLITGETGTGKELVARNLRKKTETGYEPFVAVDSATLHGATAESILFGHEKGAFTGADQTKQGLFEEANQGVIFFDEISNMPLPIQAKLLRVLQEKEVLRLGGTRPIQLTFRVICATNRDLEKMSKEGLFFPDLLQRLQVLPIDLASLRDRREDIPALIDAFFESTKRKSIPISEEALGLLQNYSWPGNIRELFGMLEYSCTLTDAEGIDVQDLHPKLRNQTSLSRKTEKDLLSFYTAVEEFEKNFLKNAYEKNNGQISKLSKSLDMDRSHLYAKLKLYGIHPIKNDPEASPHSHR